MYADEFIISAGHRKDENSGAADIINEVREARRVVKRVSEMLRDLKVKVTEIYDNTTSNQNDNLAWLVKKHNEVTDNKKDDNVLNVFLHFNSFKRTDDGMGVECYYYPTDKIGKAAAERVVDDVAKVGLKNRGAKARDDLYVLKKTYCPAILPEIAFVDSKKDVEIYNKEFENICKGIVFALCGKEWQEKKPVNQKRKGVRVYWFSPGKNAGFEKLVKFVKDNKWNHEIEYENYDPNGRKMMMVYWFTANSSNMKKLIDFCKTNKWHYDLIDEK